MTYSVVIPAYNESNRIRPTLDGILRYVDEHKWDAEILVVDDGSRDDTAAIVREYGRSHPQVQLVQNPGNRGKGYSVRRVELQSERQPLYRQLFGRIFNLLLRLVLGLHFMDTQCGFKAFRHEAAQQIFPLQKIERWGFDPEVLFLARRAGLRTVEVPVIWAHSEGTRLHPFRDGIRMFGDVMRIRWNSIAGAYSRPPVTSPGRL